VTCSGCSCYQGSGYHAACAISETVERLGKSRGAVAGHSDYYGAQVYAANSFLIPLESCKFDWVKHSNSDLGRKACSVAPDFCNIASISP